MFHYRTGRIAALMMLLSTAALPQTGYAASYLDSVPRGVKTVYTSSLADLTQAEKSLTTRTLDWQRPALELYFDLPPAERTSEIVLNLSADPLNTVARNAPLMVQFNNGKPVPVRSNGRGFEARIPFDAARAHDIRNVIRITYPIPEGANCVAPAHGAWSVDLAASTIRMSGRALRRNISLSEMSQKLSQPAFSPKRVGLVAKGPQATDMQALAAQGISLRTPGIPDFSVSSRGTDFTVFMVKRSELYSVTDEPDILESQGARVFVPRGRPSELIFTADSDAEIVQMLKLFTIRRFPNTTRSHAGLGELDLQSRLGDDTVKIEGKTPLSYLASASDIAAGAQSYKFGVADPVASSGEIRLHLSTMNNLSDNSRLRVALNGKVLGAAKLNRKRKTVAFDIAPGSLNATSNVLNIVPDLDPLEGYECPSPESLRPSFAISDNSRLILKQSVPSPETELSKLTSTGGLFSSYESYISLPKNTRDYEASLRILARMAKSSGHGLTQADYSRNPNIGTDKHRLFIGPAYMVKDQLSGAPKALRDALSGQPDTGDNLLQANFERYASAGSVDDAVKYAVSQSAPRKITRGGVAALYGAGDGNLTGVISSAPGQSFAASGESLVELSHWNALKGGVARWTPNSVVMTQTAPSDANIIIPRSEEPFELPELGLSAVSFSDFRWPDIEWPELQWPEISWPDIDMPQVNLPEFKWPDFSPKPAENTQAAAAAAKAEKMAEVIPRVKPVFKRKTAPKLTLRGPFEYKIDKPNRPGLFQNFSQGATSKWNAAKQWVKAKATGAKTTEVSEGSARATDRLQDRVKPAGSSFKESLRSKLPVNGLVKFGDRSVSVFGLMLLMAFAFILLLMSLVKPSSRSGRRH